jgi:hypothetical protein
MNTEKVSLWTRQDEKSLIQLEKYGVIHNKREYIESEYESIANYFIRLYNWFVEAASKRVPKPDEVEFPIWCSVSHANMLRPVEGTVCYELEIPREKVIYFDGSKWDYVLNHIYIPKDDQDQKDYMADLKRKGFKNEFNFIEGSYAHLYPMERKRIMDSWERIFEIDTWNEFVVQGNIWEIRPEYIKRIEKFVEKSLIV